MQSPLTSIFPRAEAGSPAFRALGQFIVRYRVVVLAIATSITAYLGFEARGLVIDTSFKAMMVAEPEAVKTLRTLQENFGREDMFVLVVEGDVFTMPYLERLRDLHEALSEVNPTLSSLGQADTRDESGEVQQVALGREADTLDDEFGSFGDEQGWGEEDEGTVVRSITSLINVSDTRYSENGLRVFGFLDDWPTKNQLPALRRRAVARKSIVGNVLGHDARHSVIYVQTEFTNQDDTVVVYNALRKVIEDRQREGFSIKITGAPGLGAEVYELTRHDMQTAIVISLALMSLILFAIFRRPLGVLVPLLLVIQAVIWTVGVMTLFDVPLTLLSAVTPAFLFCVGLGGAIHIQAVAHQKMADGMQRQQAVIHAMEHVGVPVVFTSVTTAIGLISFQFSSLHAIREFGLFGAFGVLAAMVLSLTLLPALLSFGQDIQRRSTHVVPFSETLNHLVQRCNHLSMPTLREDGSRNFRRRNRVLWFAGWLVVACVVAATHLQVVHYPLKWLPSDSPARQAVEELDAHVGGAADFTLVIEAKPGKNLRNREFLRNLQDLETYLLDYQDPNGRGHVVGSTAGLLDLVRDTNWALTGQKPDGFRIPATDRGVSDLFTLLENAAPERLRQVMTVDGRVGVMYARSQWMDDSSFRSLIAYIARGIDKYTNGEVTIRPTGAVYDAAASGGRILKDLIQSFGFALLTVMVLMTLMLANLKLGALAMIPNVLPILMVAAFMGVTSMPLDLSTLVVGSVGMGIVVDDTIHFLHHFVTAYERTDHVESAIETAFRRAGPAMIETSIVLGAGFLVFLSADLSNIRAFGTLVFVAVSSAIVADLIVVPALLRAVYKQSEPTAASFAETDPDTISLAFLSNRLPREFESE